MATRIIGKVAFRPRGNWNGNVTDYERLDTVVDSNVMYIALQDVPVGTPVSNTTYWQRCIDGFGGSAQLDTEMSDESVNGVQNKVIKAYVDTQKDRIDQLVNDVSDKVDKKDGKVLSSNDYTDEDKALVDTIDGKVDLTSEGANKLFASMESSTNAINDSQILIASSGTGYFKRKFSLVWDYIKSKILGDADVNPVATRHYFDAFTTDKYTNREPTGNSYYVEYGNIIFVNMTIVASNPQNSNTYCGVTLPKALNGNWVFSTLSGYDNSSMLVGMNASGALYFRGGTSGTIYVGSFVYIKDYGTTPRSIETSDDTSKK